MGAAEQRTRALHAGLPGTAAAWAGPAAPQEGALARFAPRAAVTGVGSLPHRDAEAAVRFVAEHAPEVPFWPQLPQRAAAEALPAQPLHGAAAWLRPRPGHYGLAVVPGRLPALLEHLRSGGAAALEEDAATGFFAFERALAAGAFPAARAVKGQVMGPVTLAHCLFEGERSFAEDPARLQALAEHAAAQAAWQVRRLAGAGLPVLLVVDEPALCLAGRLGAPAGVQLAAVQRVLAAARREGALAGLHCCARIPLRAMGAVAPDLLSYDAHGELEHVLAAAETRRVLAGGGLLAHGLVPTDPGALAEALPEARFARLLAAAWSAGEDPGRLATAGLVTASCGLGLLDEAAAARSFQAASRLARLWRSLLAEPRAAAP